MSTERALHISRSMVSLAQFLSCLKIPRGLMLSLSPLDRLLNPSFLPPFLQMHFLCAQPCLTTRGHWLCSFINQSITTQACYIGWFYERSGTKKGQYNTCNIGLNLFNIRPCCPNILAIPAIGKLSRALPPLGMLAWSPYGGLFLRDLFPAETISAHSLLSKCGMCACMHTHTRVLVENTLQIFKMPLSGWWDYQ